MDQTYTHPTICCKYYRYVCPFLIMTYFTNLFSEESGRDLMACAQTGSGKTGAMLIPVINYLINQGHKPVNGNCQKIKCLITAPTRELAQQIFDDCMRLCGLNTGIKCNIAYGGTK